MKVDLGRELDVLRSEQDQNYARTTAELKIVFEKALLSQRENTLAEMSQSYKELINLQYSMEQSLEIFKLYMAVSVASSVVISEKFGVPSEIAEHCKKQHFHKIAASTNRNQLLQVGEEAKKDLIEYFEKYSMVKYSHPVKMAIEYIHNNKFQFIYAKDIANAIKIDRSYLSTRFKQEVGVTITDYIHQVKTDLTIELMESHMYKLNEISEMLGYSNYTYFSRVFKKYKGVAPSEYVFN